MATVLLDRPMVLNDPPSDTAVHKALADIVQTLCTAPTLAAGEELLDRVTELLAMPWACWSPDTSHPYNCAHADAFARSRGWPKELMELWRNRHAAMKMPFYIRCRFEHLPFVTTLDRRGHQRVSPEHLRIDELVHGLGIATMLTVPLHLPKGQIAMLTWAGSRKRESLEALLGRISGELLALGHYFMRIYAEEIGHYSAATEEWSRLTPREWDCLRTLAQGYREAEIAELLGILKTTVRFHLDNVVKKFGCKNRTQAVALAAQLGLLGPIGP
jgi:DNA-binding CsgD family transcriptional regulator